MSMSETVSCSDVLSRNTQFNGILVEVVSNSPWIGTQSSRIMHSVFKYLCLFVLQVGGVLPGLRSFAPGAFGGQREKSAGSTHALEYCSSRGTVGFDKDDCYSLCQNETMVGGWRRLKGCIHGLALQYKKRLFKISGSFAAELSTHGMLTPHEALQLIANAVEHAYHLEDWRHVSSCASASAAVASSLHRFSVDASVGVAALHTALAHSSVPPNAPFAGCQRVVFHGSLGHSRHQILAHFLRSMAEASPRALPTLVMAEIGLREGCVSESLLEEFPNLRVIAVDPYLDNDELCFTVLRRLQRRFGAAKRFELRRASSREVAEGFNETLDLVFIDADHTYESAMADLMLWTPKVRLGGIVSGHDYHMPSFPGVVQAVNEYMTDRPCDEILHTAPDFVWWFNQERKTACT